MKFFVWSYRNDRIATGFALDPDERAILQLNLATDSVTYNLFTQHELRTFLKMIRNLRPAVFFILLIDTARGGAGLSCSKVFLKNIFLRYLLFYFFFIFFLNNITLPNVVYWFLKSRSLFNNKLKRYLFVHLWLICKIEVQSCLHFINSDAIFLNKSWNLVWKISFEKPTTNKNPHYLTMWGVPIEANARMLARGRWRKWRSERMKNCDVAVYDMKRLYRGIREPVAFALCARILSVNIISKWKRSN